MGGSARVLWHGLIRDNWLRAHLAIWPATLLTAYATAGNYSFASCWHIVLFYLPPVLAALLAIPVWSAVVIGSALITQSEELTVKLKLACHGLIFTCGWALAQFVVHAVAGQVNCL